MSADFTAKMEAAFAIELAQSKSLQALVAEVGRYENGKSIAKMLWQHGWSAGVQFGLETAKEIMHK